MKTWEEAVSSLRELAKEAEDFTSRIHELASNIQRMERDRASGREQPIHTFLPNIGPKDKE